MVSSLVLARCQPMGDGRLRWRIRFDPMRYQADVTLAVRLDPHNKSAEPPLQHDDVSATGLAAE